MIDLDVNFLRLKKVMVKKIHLLGVILVPNLSLMWADQLKKLTVVPFIYL